MSTDTSYEDDVPVGTGLNLYVEQKTILARLIDLRHPEMQVSPHFWRRFSGAELWGFLRHWPIDRVLMTVTDPLCLVVLMADDEESTAYIKISSSEYHLFLEYYGASVLLEEPKHCWLKEGF